jgi:hypothetical protein
VTNHRGPDGGRSPAVVRTSRSSGAARGPWLSRRLEREVLTDREWGQLAGAHRRLVPAGVCLSCGSTKVVQAVKAGVIYYRCGHHEVPTEGGT